VVLPLLFFFAWSREKQRISSWPRLPVSRSGIGTELSSTPCGKRASGCASGYAARRENCR